MNKEEPKLTQKGVVVNHLKKYGMITCWDSYERYGITRLSDIIFRLRGQGYVIENVTKIRRNRYGHIVNYDEYHLVKEPLIHETSSEQ